MQEKWPIWLYLGVDIPISHIRIVQSALTAKINLGLPVPAWINSRIEEWSIDIHLSDPDAFVKTCQLKILATSSILT